VGSNPRKSTRNILIRVRNQPKKIVVLFAEAEIITPIEVVASATPLEIEELPAELSEECWKVPENPETESGREAALRTANDQSRAVHRKIGTGEPMATQKMYRTAS
jgi:hypothetical protein